MCSLPRFNGRFVPIIAMDRWMGSGSEHVSKVLDPITTSLPRLRRGFLCFARSQDN